jgi:monoamine oxidase
VANGSQDDILDVAIIGAGVSGVYSGMRLLGSERASTSPLGQGALKVELFEKSGRVGGRLLSLAPPGVESTRVEVGGMRYTSQHKHVLGLVAKFGLTPVDFPVRQPQNFAYLRGEHLRMAELADAARLPYQLQGEERSEELLAKGFTAVAAERLLRNMTGKPVDLTKVDWLNVAQTLEFEGMNLADLPLRYLMQRMISHEAYAFAVDSSGYDSILYTWNGADGFPWNLSDFGVDVSYYRLAEGYQQIPLHCAEAFEKEGKLTKNVDLRSFDVVDLPDGSKGVKFRIAAAGGNITTRRARHLVLAMPRRSLELLEPTGAVMDPANTAVRRLIESVTPIPLFKLALCYSYPWWETIPAAPGAAGMQKIEVGESITDLPVRQLYYWATDPATGEAVVLIYDDGLALTFWAGLRSHEAKFAGEGGPPPGSGLSAWSDFPAPARMVEEAHRQIMEMHGVSGRPDVPRPYAAAYHDWGDDPYGGGANFWHVGVKSHEVSRAIVQPVPGAPVYICGESYSHAQGWVEGALATAEDMLQHHLGLMPPSWEGQS